MKIIVIANQKGGVAKTTTSGALASQLARRGKRVLGIDMDPQASFTENCGVKQSEDGVYAVMRKKRHIRGCIQHTERFDILPASIMMAALEQELSGEMGRECRLNEAITEDRLHKRYDYIIIDCPPALGTMTVNALVCADYVLIPTNADINAVKGIAQLNSTITNVRKYYNPRLRIVGILQTRDNSRYNISNEVRKVAVLAAKKINCRLFNTRIRNCVSAPEANFEVADLFDYDPKSTVAQDYETFVGELLKAVHDEGPGKPPPQKGGVKHNGKNRN